MRGGYLKFDQMKRREISRSVDFFSEIASYVPLCCSLKARKWYIETFKTALNSSESVLLQAKSLGSNLNVHPLLFQFQHTNFPSFSQHENKNREVISHQFITSLFLFFFSSKIIYCAAKTRTFRSPIYFGKDMGNHPEDEREQNHHHQRPESSYPLLLSKTKDSFFTRVEY